MNSYDMTKKTSNQVGFYSAIATVVLTVITFGCAMTAIPISGANCIGKCVSYPYLDTVSQYPKDYLWMYLAIPMLLSYSILMASIHSYASEDKKVFSQVGQSFSVIAVLILLVDYFVQFSVVPISLMSGETQGIPLVTQYNPHGIFIALEELGYVMMSLSLLFMAPIFANKNRLEIALRWIFVVSFIAVIASLTFISINYGLNRQDRFEVMAISVNWLVLIVGGILLGNLFKRELKAE